jgi:hypothetical protein
MAENTRILKTNEKAKAGIRIDSDAVTVVGDDRHLLAVDTRGVTIKGPVSIVADSSNIRRGGLFVGLPDFIQMIPSTAFTPVPQAVPVPPVHGLVGIAKDTAFFMALLI